MKEESTIIMKRYFVFVILFLCCLTSSSSAQFTNRFDTLVTINGREYNNARPQRIEDGLLIVFHSSGIARVALSEIPLQCHATYRA